MEVHMSRNIFTFALLVAILVVLVAGNMQAQSLVSANVGSTATVMAALSIGKTDMAFGNVPVSTAVVLNPTDVTKSSYVGSQAAVGTVTITGANSTDVIVTWPPTIPLKQTGKTDLTLTLAVNGDASNANQASAGGLSSGATAHTSAGGNYSLWVGGNMTTGTDLGLFSGSATFAVEYK